MHIPAAEVLDAAKLGLKWILVSFGEKFSEYPRFQSYADHPFTQPQLEELANHINKEYAGNYENYTAEQIKGWLSICPDIYQVVFDRVLMKERIVGCCKMLPLTKIAIEAIYNGTFESINAHPRDIAPTFEDACGIWIGDLIVSKSYRVLSSGDTVSNSLLFHLKGMIKPYLGKKLIFARSEREDIRMLLIRKGFVPILKDGETLNGHTPFVRLTDKKKKHTFSP